MSHDDFPFFHSLRVRWAEVDMQVIVFNGHYLTYFDVAFTEFWRTTGLPTPLEQSKEGRELFARRSGIEYLAPARFDDALDVGMRCAHLGNSSMRIELAIFRGEEHLISSELVYVYADAAERKSVPIPAAWREVLMPAPVGAGA
ncbi:MAG: acyl-CoA thioesterase [Candidatus Protistobacter heckmanni]|nr:acyl-CoA thioesterase [Candidatus Protistobacter heckmanni]